MRLPALTIRGPYKVALQLNASWLVTVAAVFGLLGLLVYPRQLPDLDARWTWIIAAIVTLLYLMSLLLHEVGHVIAARWFDIPIHGIQLHLFGGVSHFGGIPRRPREELALALSGPLVSLLLGWLFATLAMVLYFQRPPLGGAGAMVSTHLALYNLAALALNLIPIYPLDGGRALRGLLWGLTGNFGLSVKIVLAVGAALLVAVAGVGLLLPMSDFIFNVAAVMLALFIGRIMLRGYRQSRELAGRRVSELLDEGVRTRAAGGVAGVPAVANIPEDDEYVIECDGDGHAVCVRHWGKGEEGVWGLGTEELIQGDEPAIEAVRRMRSGDRLWLVVVGSKGNCLGLVSGDKLERRLAGE